jgi:hypothetical protein
MESNLRFWQESTGKFVQLTNAQNEQSKEREKLAGKDLQTLARLPFFFLSTASSCEHLPSYILTFIFSKKRYLSGFSLIN